MPPAILVRCDRVEEQGGGVPERYDDFRGDKGPVAPDLIPEGCGPEPRSRRYFLAVVVFTTAGSSRLALAAQGAQRGLA